MLSRFRFIWSRIIPFIKFSNKFRVGRIIYIFFCDRRIIFCFDRKAPQQESQNPSRPMVRPVRFRDGTGRAENFFQSGRTGRTKFFSGRTGRAFVFLQWDGPDGLKTKIFGPDGPRLKYFGPDGLGRKIFGPDGPDHFFNGPDGPDQFFNGPDGPDYWFFFLVPLKMTQNTKP